MTQLDEKKAPPSQDLERRETQRTLFVEKNGWNLQEMSPLAQDASFRRYFRLAKGDTKRAILMDAPAPQEQTGPFVTIAKMLHHLKLSAPEIYDWDEKEGFMLLEDLGDMTYNKALSQGQDEEKLYKLALDVLIHIHKNYKPSNTAPLPPYSYQKLLDEVALFMDFYYPAIMGSPPTKALRQSFLELWVSPLEQAQKVPSSLVLRDYHIDNMLVLKRPHIKACGLLDFQDAVLGPITYDLASLFEDARRDVNQNMAQNLLEDYLAHFPHLNSSNFFASYAIMTAQRNAKILGIFYRIQQRTGKDLYLKHIPRVRALFEQDINHPALSSIKDWYQTHIPQEHRSV